MYSFRRTLESARSHWQMAMIPHCEPPAWRDVACEVALLAVLAFVFFVLVVCFGAR
jgi:hypothetical protein